MAFQIPALQLLLTPYELTVGPVGPSKSGSGDCNLERKKVCTCPRGAGGVDTSQECSEPSAQGRACLWSCTSETWDSMLRNL